MQTANLMMDQSSASMMEPAASPAGIKSILFHVQDDKNLADRLDAALSIARTFGAHLHLLHVTPIQAYTVTDAFATYVSANIVTVLEEEAAKLRAKLVKHLASEDVSWDYEQITGALMPHFVQRAALADLVLTGREAHEWDFGRPPIGLLGDMLDSIRTPMFIPGDNQRQIDLFGPAVVAWNGSYEAANALRSAVPLLKLASQVRIFSVEEPRDMQFPAIDAPEYLSRHDIHAELIIRKRLAGGIAEQLLDEAVIDGAGYMVMGGYSHSRAGEFLFGGMTRSLLSNCPIGLLISR